MIKKSEKYLVTGGTGVVGYKLCERILGMGGKVRVLSHGEDNLKKLKDKYNEIEIVCGDISNQQDVRDAMVDIKGVYHLAAVAEGMQSGKPLASIQTNIIGSIKVLLESTETDFVLGVSSDKAVNVSGTYGATKFLMEKLFAEFEEINPYTKYRVVRLGNVIYSHDSVLCKWKKLIESGDPVIITEPSATRFIITQDQSIDLIFNCLEKSTDSKPYTENMKSTSMDNLLKAMIRKYCPSEILISSVETIGLQQGENLHEKITEDGLYSNETEQYTIEELEEII